MRVAPTYETHSTIHDTTSRDPKLLNILFPFVVSSLYRVHFLRKEKPKPCVGFRVKLLINGFVNPFRELISDDGGCHVCPCVRDTQYYT